MTYPYGETVTRLRGTPVPDPYSEDNTTLDWTNPAAVSYPGCAVWETGSEEPVEASRVRSSADRDPVRSDFTASLPPDADITSQDRVLIRGLVCEVSGRPFVWTNPFTGWTPGMIVRAKIQEG